MNPSRPQISLPEVYQVTSEVTLESIVNMALPPKVIALTGEAAYEALTMPDDEVRRSLTVCDAEAAARSKDGKTPGEMRRELVDHLRATRIDEQEWVNLFAEQEDRAAVAGAVFQNMLASTYPELPTTTPQGREARIQGSFMASVVTARAFNRAYVPPANPAPIRLGQLYHGGL